MLLKQLMEIYDLLDRPDVTGQIIADLFVQYNADRVTVKTITGEKGSTDFIQISVFGNKGKSAGFDSPTLGILGRLGGIGARPNVIGAVSDGDGAIVALTAALKILDMKNKGDILNGDVIISTHICPHAPVIPHEPVPFMGAPVDMATMNREEVSPEMDAILSIDTTKGNRVINHRGIAISPTVKEGYILRVSDDLLDIMQSVTGQLPVIFAITTQDITPYGNGLYHLNSIMQPACGASVPVVGLAITAESIIAGCATGASQFIDMEMCARFAVEIAKRFGDGTCRFYDPSEFAKILDLYGSMTHLQFGSK